MKRLSLLLCTLLLCMLWLFPVTAQQSRNNRTPEEYINLLESERRISGLQVSRVIETLRVKPGQRVGDIGAGSGLFTRPLARKVGSKGMVYAVDVDAELLKHIDRTAQEQKLTGIRTILAPEDDPKFPEPVDLIVIIDTLHHIANQPKYLKGLKRYLRRGGRIAIIDFSNEWPAGHEQMKYTPEDLDAWMKAANFKLAGKHDFLTNDFFVVYK